MPVASENYEIRRKGKSLKPKACLSTFMERKSRYLIAQVMENRKAETFNNHCFIAFNNVSSALVEAFTVDRDKEELTKIQMD